MTGGTSQEINYWPAYVDALINVVLNLLFLVGVFTIGLVSLNGQALLVEQAANKRKLDTLTAAKSQAEKQRLTREMLQALPIPPQSPKPVSVDRDDALLKFEQPRITEIRLKGPAAQLAVVTSPSLTETKQSAATQPSITTVNQFMASLSNGGDIHRIGFDINQYSQPADWVWPQQVQARAAQKTWSLYVIADPTNPRLSREAFARLVFVRSALVNAGALPENVQLKVTPAPEAVVLPDGIDRTVWVIERAR